MVKNMILDAAILIIVAMAVVKGFRRGLFYMALRILVWIGAIAAGVFLTGPLADILADGFVGDIVSKNISEKFSSSMTAAGDACAELPDLISGGITATGNSAAALLTDMFTGLITSVIAFAVIIFAVRLAAHILMSPASRRRKKSILGMMNRTAGAAAGALKGLIVVFVLLALLVPVVNLAGTEVSDMVTAQLAESHFTKDMYDNNLLLLIVEGVFS